MGTWYVTQFRRRPLRAGVLTLACVVLVIVGVWQVIDWSHAFALDRALEEVTTARGGASTIAVVQVRFRRGLYRLEVPVGSAEVDAAERVPTIGMFGGSVPKRQVALANVVRAQSRSQSVTRFAAELRRLRRHFNLGDDEYVELISAAVQQIPYGIVDRRIDFAANVLTRGQGVCSEKSILLAAVLVHEGYDAGICVFDTQRHVTAAVRGEGGGFARSGYSLIETTRESYVGQVSEECQARGPISFRPQLVRANVGGRRYRSDFQTEFILAQRDYAQSSAERLSQYHGYIVKATGSRRREYAALAARQKAATRLAGFIDGGVKDRGRTYELLTRSGGR